MGLFSGITDALFGNNKPPDPPDFAGAAEATAAGDLESARYQTLANRPDEYNPYGSRTWEQGLGGDPDKWAATTTLSPEAQQAMDLNLQTDIGSAGLGLQAIGQMENIFSKPFTGVGGSPEYQGVATAMPSYGSHRGGVVNAMMSRVNEDITRDRDQLNSQLIAQGIPPGSEAYNTQMQQLDRKQTDARQQAEISAEKMAGMGYQSSLAGRNMMNQENMADYSTGLQSYQQSVQDALLQRQTPINEWSAFRTGSQVAQPQFQPYGQQQFTGGPNYLGAAGSSGAFDMAGYNAETAQQNAMIGGLFGLGAAGIGQGGIWT